MSLRTARALTGVYLFLMLVFVTWPGLTLVARIEPFVLGMPLSLAWIAAWVAGALFVLWGLDRVESRYRRQADSVSAATEESN